MSSPADVTIRRALRDEAEAIAALVRAAFDTEAHHYEGDPSRFERTEDVLAALDAGDVMLVAERDGMLVGTVRGTAGDGAVELCRLSVSPDARRLGIGRALALALEAEYPETPFFELCAGSLSTDAIALYESLGYEYARSEELEPGVTLVWLEKSAQ